MSILVDSEDEIGESAAAFNRLVEALSASMKTQMAVRSFSEMLTSQLEIENLADEALRQFAEHAGAAGGLILYEVGGELKIAASLGLRDPQSVAASGHVDAAVRSGERQVVTIPDDVRLEGVVTDFRPGEVLVSPVTYKSVPLGVVVLATGGTFAPDQRALIELFLQGLGLALNNAIAHDRLQNLAALDPLTGIYNRRFGLGRLREEFGRAVRVTSPLGVLMFDIDHFKAVNDTYGHLVGDRVLKSVCTIVRSSLREGDVLLRYGGEELLAVLPAASTEDLRQMGERLRQAVEDSAVADGEKTVRVTLSVGGAAYPKQNVEHEDGLLRLADEALYRAKEGGRNRVDDRDVAAPLCRPAALPPAGYPLSPRNISTAAEASAAYMSAPTCLQSPPSPRKALPPTTIGGVSSPSASRIAGDRPLHAAQVHDERRRKPDKARFALADRADQVARPAWMCRRSPRPSRRTRAGRRAYAGRARASPQAYRRSAPWGRP